MNALESLPFIRSELFLIGIAFLILILDFFVAKKSVLGWLAIAGTFTAIWMALSAQTQPEAELFFGYFILDSFTQFFRLAAFTIVGLTLLAALAYEKIPEHSRGEFYFLLILFAALLPVMASVSNLLMVFLAIESVSMTSYLVTGFQKFDKRSSEASLKYLLFGSVSSALMLFGISLLFGAARSINLSEISASISLIDPPMRAVGVLGFVLLLAGIGFKISAVPFHMWAPDVYQGAPTPVTAFLTVGPKALGFAVLIRVLFLAFPVFVEFWEPLLVWIAILTMTAGNLIAISQTDIKRLLAYSSIAQAGYILAGLATANKLGLEAVLIYVMAYAVTNLGAFFTVLAVERNIDTNQLEGYSGLSKRSPFLALVLAFFLLSLAGIPPMAGFLGKLYIFSAAVYARHIGLAIAIGLNSAIAAYYYFKVIKAVYLTQPETDAELKNPASIRWAIGLSAIGVIAIGLLPAFFIQLAEQALLHFPNF